METLKATLERPAGLRYAEAAPAAKAGDRPWALYTGFRELDRILGGLRPSQLCVVAARPGDGGSQFARALAERVAVDQRQGVLFFSLEATLEDVAVQMARARARDPLMLDQTAQKIAASPLFIDDSADLRVEQLRERARRGRHEMDVEFIVIDGLHHVQTGLADNPRDLAFVAAQVRSVAIELAVPIVATAPIDASFHAAADAMIVFLREAALAELVVAKNPAGTPGVAHLAFAADTGRFENVGGRAPA